MIIRRCASSADRAGAGSRVGDDLPRPPTERAAARLRREGKAALIAAAAKGGPEDAGEGIEQLAAHPVAVDDARRSKGSLAVPSN